MSNPHENWHGYESRAHALEALKKKLKTKKDMHRYLSENMVSTTASIVQVYTSIAYSSFLLFSKSFCLG